MRRARLTVKPNVGGPKPRQTAVKQTEGIIKVEGASGKTVRSNVIKEGDSSNTQGTAETKPDISPANETKSSEKKVPVRRPAAKPKPNLPGRGTNQNKLTGESITTEPNANATEGFTSIKTSLSESDVPKEIIESKAEELENKTEKKDVSDNAEVIQEEKNATEPDTSADDNKKESKQLPSRFRSRFAKARPNVEAVARPRIRHPSLSQNETDNISMKEPPPVQRVVTLTSSESATSLPVFAKPKEIQSGKDLIDIRKTPLKAPVREEYVHKQDGQSKKKKKLLVLDDPVDRGKLKMKDLIHMNPKSNPMKTLMEVERERKDSLSSVSPIGTPRKRKDSSTSNTSTSRVKIGPDGQIVIDEDETEIDKENEKIIKENDGGDEGDGDDSVPAPQVTIGADGQIVLNEASLVLDNPIHETSQEDMEVVHESNWSKPTSQYGYKKKRVKLWTEAETKKFYLALNAVGTDFSLMVKLFPGRTRTELKRKWQKEEKTSRHLLDKAIKDRYQFENDFFEELRALDKLDEDLRESKQKKKNDKPTSKADDQSESKTNTKRVRKKEIDNSLPADKKGEPTNKKRKKAKNKLYVDSSSESDQEEPQFLEKDTPSTHGEETIDEAQVIANFQSKPSRSGRTIKTFILGQPGATSTVTTSTDGGSSPLLSPKPSTEIRIRRISGTSGSPGHPVGRLRTLSTSSQGSTRVRTLSGSSTASVGKTPSQFLVLSNIPQTPSESPTGANDMQPGSLVFVQSNPTVDEKGEVTPGLVHIYMVSSPSSTNTPSAAIEPVSGATCTPGGFKSNQFSFMRTSDSETDVRERKLFHCPSVLGKPQKQSTLSPREAEDLLDGKSLSHTLSESHTLLEQDSSLPVIDMNCENANLQTAEVMRVSETLDVSQGDSSYNGLTVGNEELVEQTEDVVSDQVEIVNEGEKIVYVEITTTTKNDSVGE